MLLSNEPFRVGVGKVKVEQSKFKTLRPRAAMPAQFPNDIMSVSAKMATIWHKAMRDTAVFKDLCRLARRITLKVKGAPLAVAADDEPPLVVLSKIISEGNFFPIFQKKKKTK